MMKKIIFFMALSILVFSCNQKRPSTKAIVKEWQDKTILIPKNIEFRTKGRDTTCTELLNSKNKILTYVDSTGCTACQMRLSDWQNIIDSCALYDFNINFLFIVHSNQYVRLGYDTENMNFTYPIIYDRKNEFDKLNHFPPEPYRTFLLDKDNKVLLVGSPIGNPKMWALYKKVIMQNE